MSRVVRAAKETPYEGFFDRIFCKSSEAMPELPDSVVALTVTSPPYWNAIDYDVHAADPSRFYRTRRYASGFREYEEYLEWFAGISDEVLRVTKPGGFYSIVVGTVLLNGRHYPVPFDMLSMLTRRGWEFRQDFIWHKVTGGVKRAGVFLQKPFPGYFYPNIMTEYILVLRKPGPPIFEGRDSAERAQAAFPTGRLFTNEIAHNVWHIAPVPPGHLDHPCPFPEEIPWRLIHLFSYPGDLVLDPFCGTGQTLKVARHLGRHFVGYDIVEKYVRYAEKRLQEPLAVRRRQLLATFEKIDIDAERTGPRRRSGKTRYGKRETTSSTRGLPHDPEIRLFPVPLEEA